MDAISWILFFVVILFAKIAWGIAVNMMINKRGYYENWFWWGFFFGVIAFIVTYLKPPYCFFRRGYERQDASYG